MTADHDRADATPRSRSWRLLGSAAALSMPVTYAFAPIGMTGPLLVDRSRLGGSLLVWLVIAGLGQLAVMGCFAVARRVLHPPGAPEVRPVATLVAIVLAAALRGWVIAVAAATIGPAEQVELGYRVVVSMPLIGGTLIVAAVLVSARDEHVALLRRLEHQRAQLAILDASMQGRLAEVRERLLRQVRTSLEPGLMEVSRALDAASDGSDPSEHLARLRTFVDHDLHDLSRSILAPVDPSEPQVADDGAPRRRVRWPATISLRDCLRPGVQGSLTGVAAVGSAIRDLPPPSALVFVVALSAATAGGIALVRAVVGRASARLTLAVVVSAVVGAGVTFAGVRLVAVSGLPSPRLVDGPALVLGASLGAFCALFAALDQQRSATQDELTTTIERLQASIAALRQHTWMARRRLSLLMHGSVQGALHAAAMRLGATAPADAAAIDAIRRDVETAMARFDSLEADPAALDRTLSELAQTWEGVCTVTWQVDPHAATSLRADPDCGECTAEVVREGVHNAIVHGGARTVEVDVALESDRVVVRVSDDGKPSAGAPGLGSEMLDEMCLSWSRTASESGSVLAAELAPL